MKLTFTVELTDEQLQEIASAVLCIGGKSTEERKKEAMKAALDFSNCPVNPPTPTIQVVSEMDIAIDKQTEVIHIDKNGHPIIASGLTYIGQYQNLEYYSDVGGYVHVFKDGKPFTKKRNSNGYLCTLVNNPQGKITFEGCKRNYKNQSYKLYKMFRHVGGWANIEGSGKNYNTGNYCGVNKTKFATHFDVYVRTHRNIKN